MPSKKVKKYRSDTAEFLGWKRSEVDGTWYWVTQDFKKVMRCAFWAPDKASDQRERIENHILLIGDTIDWFLGKKTEKESYRKIIKGYDTDISIFNEEEKMKFEGYGISRESALMNAFERYYKSRL